MSGLGHFFAGLVEGVGETTMKLEKEKRDRTERERTQQLDLYTRLLSMPDIDPETKNEIFGSALDVASGGNKKIKEQIHGTLGPVLQGQMGSSGGGGVSDANPIVGGSPLPKFGPAPQRKPFLSHQDQLEQKKNEVKELGQVQQDLNVNQAQRISDINVQGAVSQAKQMQELEEKQLAEHGFQPLGLTKPDEKGQRRMVYHNPSTGAKQLGEPLPPFDTMQSIEATGTMQAKSDIEVKQETDTVLRAMGIAPAKATPEQREKASQAAAKMTVEAQQAGTTLKQTQAFAELLRAQAAGEKGIGGLTDAQLLTFYGSQERAHDKRGNDIQQVISEFNKQMDEANQLWQQVQAIDARLSQAGIGRDAEDMTDPQYQDRAKQGITYAERDRLSQQVHARVKQAKMIAQQAKARFGPDVDVAGEEGDPTQSWPTLRNNQGDFQFRIPQGLPEMPSERKKKARGSAPKTQVTVPTNINNLLNKYNIQ